MRRREVGANWAVVEVGGQDSPLRPTGKEADTTRRKERHVSSLDLDILVSGSMQLLECATMS